MKNLTERWTQLRSFFFLFFLLFEKGLEKNYVLTEISYTFYTKTLLLLCISLLRSFIYRRGKTFQILLGATAPVTLKNQIKAIHFLSEKIVPLLKLFVVRPQQKSSQNKNHVYVTDSEYSACLLKKYSRIQHISQSGFVKRLVGL